jgi:hypothetical protein
VGEANCRKRKKKDKKKGRNEEKMSRIMGRREFAKA